ncbi:MULTISPECIES: hypothetical protein [Aeromonas]|nr:hypothetical protein [Aeromonas caviae]
MNIHYTLCGSISRLIRVSVSPSPLKVDNILVGGNA